MPNDEISFDSLHLKKYMNDPLSQVQVKEASFYPDMTKGSHYAFLRNPENITEKQDEALTRLCGFRLKTALTYVVKLTLQEVYFAPTREEAEICLRDWYGWAIRSQIEQVRTVAKTVKTTGTESCPGSSVIFLTASPKLSTALSGWPKE